jgi:hypothetical protein
MAEHDGPLKAAIMRLHARKDASYAGAWKRRGERVSVLPNIARKVVERVVADIDEIVRHVRFPGWQNTMAGEREVKKALRKTLFKYALHQDEELFEKSFGYIRQYY